MHLLSQVIKLNLPYLHVHTNWVKSRIHYSNPSVFRGQNKECHQGLSQIIKIILPIDPAVFIKKTVSLSSHILQVGSSAVVKRSYNKMAKIKIGFERKVGESRKYHTIKWKSLELECTIFVAYVTLEELNSKDSKNHEESTTDKNNISNGSKGGEKSLYYKFESRGSVNHSQGTKRTKESKDTKNSKYFWTVTKINQKLWNMWYDYNILW